jgi:uncharacterized membrane protein
MGHGDNGVMSAQPMRRQRAPGGGDPSRRNAGIRDPNPKLDRRSVMARAEISTTINRPVDEVFAVLSNVENNPKWSSAALEAETISAGPIGVGTRARFVGKFLGRRIESESEITEFEPNRKLAFQNTSGPFPFRASMTFEGFEGGTRVKATFEAEPGGFFKLAEPLFVSMGKRQFENDLANLKDLMEAHAL